MKPYVIAMGLVLAAGIALSAAAPSAHAKPRVPAAGAGDGSGISDEQLLAATYGGPHVYAGGYQESLGEDYFYYVNTISTGMSSGEWIELCSDDVAQAAAWANMTNTHSSVLRSFESQRETERFYEFRFGDPAPAASALLMRVHKCSYVEPFANLLDAAGALALGTYNGSLSQTALRRFAEYEWFIRHDRWYGQNLLSASTTKAPGAVTVTLYQTNFVDGGMYLCDEVSLVRVAYETDLTSRQVTKTAETVRTIEGDCPPVG